MGFRGVGWQTKRVAFCDFMRFYCFYSFDLLISFLWVRLSCLFFCLSSFLSSVFSVFSGSFLPYKRLSVLLWFARIVVSRTGMTKMWSMTKGSRQIRFASPRWLRLASDSYLYVWSSGWVLAFLCIWRYVYVYQVEKGSKHGTGYVCSQ